MECGKLTAKLRDMVTVRFFDGDGELRRYKNIEMPDELKKQPYKAFEFSVPLDGSITFKIWLEENPTEWPEAKKRKKRAKVKDESSEDGKEEKKKIIKGEGSEDGEKEKIEGKSTDGEEEKIEVKGADGEKKITIKYAGDRKTLVASLSAILSLHPQYLGLPSYAYQVGEYRVEKDGTISGPENKEIREKLRSMGFQEA